MSATEVLFRELLHAKEEQLATLAQAKAEVVQSKDEQLAALAHAKDELLRSKDAQLAKDEQLLRAVKDAAAAQLLALRADLSRAAEEATRRTAR